MIKSSFRRMNGAITTLLLLSLSNTIHALSTPTASSATNSIQSALTNQMILAPLTRGGNLPFRRLCADFGMETSMSEMIYARSLLKGSPVEQARLRRSTNERTFGVQFATNQVTEGLEAIQQATKLGYSIDFIDLNCGCPIYDVTRRGLGSSLLRSPKKLHNLVKGLVDGNDIPITVKIRLGCEADTINCLENVRAIREAGAAAITIHGRTAQQGYSKDSDWDLIKQAVIESKQEGYGHVPIIGNGDILTYYEAKRRMEESGVHSVMVGRGALIKPWIFTEFKDGKSWSPDAKERIQIYRRLASYMKDHFGNDEMGRKKSFYFLPWHFEFLARYTPYPEEDYGIQSMDKPLIQKRIQIPDVETNPLDALLANRNSDTHEIIASLLWESDSDDDAFSKLNDFAQSHKFKEIILQGADTNDVKEDKVLANTPSGKAGGKWTKRRGRKPGPKRTEEEIAMIRAKRALKKEQILAGGGIWPPN